jgi:hypothetical protein
MEAQREQEIYMKTLLSFKRYSRNNIQLLCEEPLARFTQLTAAHQQLVPGFIEKMKSIRECILNNQVFLDAVFDSNWDSGSLNSRDLHTLHDIS